MWTRLYSVPWYDIKWRAFACYSASDIGQWSVAMSVSVCMFVRAHSSLVKFSMNVADGRGSLLLWQRCDTLWTSGFVFDDVMLAHFGHKYQRRKSEYSKWLGAEFTSWHVLKLTHQWAAPVRGRSLMWRRTALFDCVVSRASWSCLFTRSATSVRATATCRARLPDWPRTSDSGPTSLLHQPASDSGMTPVFSAQ